MAQHLSPETGKIITRLELETDFPSRIIKAYIPSLPPAGRDALTDLPKYCRIVGLMFRAWAVYTKGREGRPGLRVTIDEALQKRRERIAGMRRVGDIERLIDLEGRMMLILATKLERNTQVE